MSSFGYNGSVRMNPEIEKENFDPMFEEGSPLAMPKVYLEGSGEEYFPQWKFSWVDDSVVMVRDKHVVKYTRSSFAELLAKNEEGEIVWMDGRRAPYSNCWKGEYLDEEREAHDFTIEEYDLKTRKKRKYKVSLEEETEVGFWDYYKLSNFVDADKFGIHFEIENGALLGYVGECSKLIIPEGVSEVKNTHSWIKKDFDMIVIPKTLTKISDDFFRVCKSKEIIVDDDNPKFYTNEGCLIDKETGTLVCGYATNEIPRDNSIHKVGPYAFGYRDDLESVVIPDNITKIERFAFAECQNMKYALISDAVDEIGGGAFDGCHSLSLVSLPRSLTKINGSVFANCNSLESIEIPESVLTVDKFAFINCDGLKEIGVSCNLVESIEEALNAKLIRDRGRWRIERLPSQEPKMPSITIPVKTFSLESYCSENLPF